MSFKLISPFKPTGDQPQAIEKLVSGIENGLASQTLLGVTGSGKTFTVANVIEQIDRPVLVLSHNKTLAAQLYNEFKNFFPDNAVEYFVSYYDYYQPEAFIPVSNTYIEKDLQINDEIEKLRLSTTSSLLSGRRDIIVVSSVSCLYGIGNPEDFNKTKVEVKRGQLLNRDHFLRQLVDAMYFRSEAEFVRGSFRVKGDTVDIYLAYSDMVYRIVFWDNEVEEIKSYNPITGQDVYVPDEVSIHPANIFVTTKERINSAIKLIQDDLVEQVEYLKSIGKHLEAKRLLDRTEFDLEMIRELGYCSGIENYSR
ncbi:MAG: DEAD/DEAH box helicase family protein, partial [Bacteroidales bacterium]|nr:DEAD/DEAH box helicase family protein [Bacteroidales bacterium]